MRGLQTAWAESPTVHLQGGAAVKRQLQGQGEGYLWPGNAPVT